MTEPRTLYLTTPIYYVNDIPHVGHAYTTIAADVVTRARRLAGHDAFLLTGTDEHGQNIERIAREKGIPEQQHCDLISAKFRDLWESLDIRYDDFIRTTEDRHQRGALHLWSKLLRGNRAGRASRDLPRQVRRLVLSPLRRIQGRRGAEAAGEPVPRPRAALRLDRGGELLLPPLGLRGLAAGRDRKRPDTNRSRWSEERGPVRHSRGSPGLQREPGSGEVGDPHTRAARPRPLRVGRRALELHHRPWLRGRRTPLPTVLGGSGRTVPPHRQGHHPLPLPLLAGAPEGRGHSRAHPLLRPGLDHEERQEAQQDHGQRHRPGEARERPRARRRALFPAARGRLRPGLGLHGLGVRHPLQRGPGQRPRQPGVAGAHHGAAATATARCRPDPGCRAPGPSASRRSSRPMARSPTPPGSRAASCNATRASTTREPWARSGRGSPSSTSES